jgi:glutaryl-CoA dehydrogenase
MFARAIRTSPGRSAGASSRALRLFTVRSVSTATFNWEDPLNAASLFTEDELAIQETARAYCQEQMLPRVLGI